MRTKGVDPYNTISNNIIEVQETLGIDVARTCIINEIDSTLKCHGLNVDKRHLMLLADVMTYRGEVVGIKNVIGLQKMNKSPLALASSEATANPLFNAAVNGRENRLEGVSESIMMGTPIKIGSGMIKVIQRVDEQPSEQSSRPNAIFTGAFTS
ncbi:RNA polymerase Rpb1, domain [Trema orientale]|uniref:DNA-directed RNA polymerase n=1 Tax=Trema orientale TaxID=63057 RepID=A0A2P5DJ31_TREOI|nr:RNA polymerase Rpb1, domain [Trema orientale]